MTEPIDVADRREAMVLLSRVAAQAILVAVLVGLVAGCTSAASPSPSPSRGASPLTEPAAKAGLLVRFGPLV